MEVNTRAVVGLGQLAVDGVVGVSRIAETLHAQILGHRRDPEGAALRLGGISGLVYGSVRGIARLVGGGVELGARLAPRVRQIDLDAARLQPLRAILNGVLGDHLAASGNPLALPMRLRHGGAVLDPVSISTLPRDAVSSHLIILLHGLCLGPEQWRRRGHDHGAVLAAETGATVLYLEYNSGLHIGDNGAELALLMQQLIDAWPLRLRRLSLIGHSMGGLVARSALQQAGHAGLEWPQRTRDLVCLGSPHLGAPLEVLGNQVERQMRRLRYIAPFALIGGARSAGITDLRQGELLNGRASKRIDRNAAELPATLRCHVLAGVMHPAGTRAAQRWIGDGLVPLASALGERAETGERVVMPHARRAVLEGVGHFDLLEDPRVAAQLRRWLKARPGQRNPSAVNA